MVDDSSHRKTSNFYDGSDFSMYKDFKVSENTDSIGLDKNTKSYSTMEFILLINGFGFIKQDKYNI